MKRAFVMHGLGEHVHRVAYSRLGRSLIEDLGFDEVFALDHEGHGLSQGARIYAEDWQHLVQDAVALVDQEAGRGQNDTNIIWGHSMGTIITLNVCLARPELFASGCAVFSGPAVITRQQDLKLVPILGKVSYWAPRLPVSKLAENSLVADPESSVHTAAADDPLMSERPIVARFAYGLLQGQQSGMAGMEQFGTRFLTMHGEADKLCECTISEGLYARTVNLRGREDGDHAYQKDKIIYPGLGHELLHEDSWRDVLTDAGQFINMCLKTSE
jgi:alpha-beta hydrolase superfamily lysophospholipase